MEIDDFYVSKIFRKEFQKNQEDLGNLFLSHNFAQSRAYSNFLIGVNTSTYGIDSQNLVLLRNLKWSKTEKLLKT